MLRSTRLSTSLGKRLPACTVRSVSGPSHVSANAGGKPLKIPVGQGGTLSLQLDRLAAQLKIKSAWIDHTELTLIAPRGSPAFAVKVSDDKSRVTVTDENIKHSFGSDKYEVQAVVPEKFNLELQVSNGDIEIGSKVEGNTTAVTENGHIVAHKLRGPRLNLSAPRGRVSVGKYLEGDMRISTAALKAKMLKGNGIRITVSGAVPGAHDTAAPGCPVDVEALFGTTALVTCSTYTAQDEHKPAVQVQRSHGATTVVVSGGSVSLGGVNGSAMVQTVGGAIDVSYEAMQPGSSSSLTSIIGHIRAVVSPELDLDVRMESTGQGDGDIAVHSDRLKESERSRSVVAGRLQGKKPESSRAGMGQHRSGKIDLKGAGAQALKTFSVTGSGAPTMEEESALPSLSMKTGGKLSLQTLSWMDVIKKQFGVEHIDYKIR